MKRIAQALKRVAVDGFDSVSKIPPRDPQAPFRPSGLHEICMRAESIKILNGIEIEEKRSSRTEWTLGFGTAVGEWIQDFVLAPILLGRWKCTRCAAVHKDKSAQNGWMRRPSVCGKRQVTSRKHRRPCPGTHFRYIETRRSNKHLTGATDGITTVAILKEFMEQKDLARTTIAKLPDLTMLIVDTKTMRPELFKWVDVPQDKWPADMDARDKSSLIETLKKWRVQFNSYMELNDAYFAIAFVINKLVEDPAKSIKTLLFEYEPEVIHEQKRRIDSFRAAVAGGSFADREGCSSHHDGKALACPVRSFCFRDDIEAEATAIAESRAAAAVAGPLAHWDRLGDLLGGPASADDRLYGLSRIESEEGCNAGGAPDSNPRDPANAVGAD